VYFSKVLPVQTLWFRTPAWARAHIDMGTHALAPTIAAVAAGVAPRRVDASGLGLSSGAVALVAEWASRSRAGGVPQHHWPLSHLLATWVVARLARTKRVVTGHFLNSYLGNHW
jgi:hypothetical protein